MDEKLWIKVQELPPNEVHTKYRGYWKGFMKAVVFDLSFEIWVGFHPAKRDERSHSRLAQLQKHRKANICHGKRKAKCSLCPEHSKWTWKYRLGLYLIEKEKRIGHYGHWLYKRLWKVQVLNMYKVTHLILTIIPRKQMQSSGVNRSISHPASRRV